MKRQKARARKQAKVASYRGRKRYRYREPCLGILAVVLLAAAALCLTVLPGARFSGCLAIALAGVCVLAVLLGRWAERSAAGRICQRVFRGALAAGLLLFLTVEGVLLFHGERDDSALPVDAVIVLGAGVNGETPSLILRSRIDTAAAYLEQHPDVPVVLSGGQGPGESISEAEAMRRALWTNSEAWNARYLLEDKSTSTAENLAFSKAVLQEHGVDTETAVIAVVTSDFHCFRAHLIARREGLTVIDIPAEVPWRLLEANYYIREFFALGKTLVFD